MKIEDYKANPIEGQADNYVGYLPHSRMTEVASAFDERHIPRSTASVQIGKETYYRCGALIAATGTRVDHDEFKDWCDKFGIGHILTETQLKELIPVVDVD